MKRLLLAFAVLLAIIANIGWADLNQYTPHILSIPPEEKELNGDSIFVRSHEMSGISFSPDPAVVDEMDCLTVEVFGGCTIPTDNHVMTVVDWGGVMFGTFTQTGSSSDKTEGELELFPGCCDASVYYIEVEDHCTDTGLREYDTLMVTVNEAVDYPIKVSLNCGQPIDVWPGINIDVPVQITNCDEEIGGYNFLLHFDGSVLILVDVRDMYGMEHFLWDTWQVGDGERLRIVGIANRPNQIDTDPIPGCLVKEGIIDLYFHVSARWAPNDTTPISFEIDDPCVDNTMTNATGQILYQAKENWLWGGDHMEGDSVATCFGAFKAHKLYGTQVRNVGIVDPRGDVNMDYLPYTIADVVYFMEYLKGRVELFDPVYQDTASDVNLNAIPWEMADFITIILVINGSQEPPETPPDTTDLDTVWVSMEEDSNQVKVASRSGFALGGAYFVLTYEPGELTIGTPLPTERTEQMMLEYSIQGGELKLILCGRDFGTYCIPPGSGPLVTIPVTGTGHLILQEADLCDSEGNLLKIEVLPSGMNTYGDLTAIVDKFKLSQNYPNPFNPLTEIIYTLPKGTHVKLEVYNVLGQKIATLVHGKQKAGYKTARWDAGSLASGIYFYRLQAGDFVQTRKMVLLR